MSHPFGDLLNRYLHRKHALSQSKLAEGILQDPSVITKMCKGQRLTGAHARARVLAIASWLCAQTAIEATSEANALLAAAGMTPLRTEEAAEQALLNHLQPHTAGTRFPAGFPSSGMARWSNLPAAPTGFVGREAQLARLAKLLSNRD